MSKRELIDTGSDKRYVRCDDKGRFKESTDMAVRCLLTKDIRLGSKPSREKATAAITTSSETYHATIEQKERRL